MTSIGRYPIVFCPVEQIALLIIVCDKGDLLIVFHRDLLVRHTNLSRFVPAIENPHSVDRDRRMNG